MKKHYNRFRNGFCSWVSYLFWNLHHFLGMASQTIIVCPKKVMILVISLIIFPHFLIFIGYSREWKYKKKLCFLCCFVVVDILEGFGEMPERWNGKEKQNSNNLQKFEASWELFGWREEGGWREKEVWQDCLKWGTFLLKGFGMGGLDLESIKNEKSNFLKSI